jgi:hypothetical protein
VCQSDVPVERTGHVVRDAIVYRRLDMLARIEAFRPAAWGDAVRSESDQDSASIGAIISRP